MPEVLHFSLSNVNPKKTLETAYLWKGAWPIEKHYEWNKCLIFSNDTFGLSVKAFFITIQNSKRLYKYYE